MKALRTKVILSGIVLVFAFIATIGTTFAWFTVSQTATVETLTLNVTAEDSLVIQVAPHAETDLTNAPATSAGYQTFLTNQDLYDDDYLFDDAGAQTGAWRLRPVTAITDYYDGTNLGLVDPFDLRTITATDADKTISASENAADINSSTGRFIEIKFYVLYQSDDYSQADLILSNPSITENASDQSVGNSANSIRLSVVADNGTTAGTEYLFGNTVDFGFEYQPGDDGYVASPAAYTAFNTLSTINMLDGSNNLDPTTVTNAANVVLFDDAATTTLYTIVPDVPLLVTVRIFVEGWAINTTDDIIDAIFDIGFGFTITNETV